MLADVFQTLVLIFSFALVFLRWDFFKKEKVIWLLLLAIIVQLASWLHAQYYYPNIAQESPRIGRLLELFFFFFIAFWLRGRGGCIWAVLISFTIGSIFTLSQNGLFISDFMKGISGYRVDFGYRNAQHGALIIGASVLILFACCGRIMNDFPNKKLLLLCFALITPIFLVLLMIMQTRQAILGLFLSVLAVISYHLIINKKVTIKNSVAFLFFFLGLIVLGLNLDVVSSRLNSEVFIVTDYLLKGDFESIPYTSLGVRINLWIESIHWIKESPFIGFGNGIEEHLIVESTRLPSFIVDDFRHVHNSYVATLLRFGGLGLVICLILQFYPVFELLKYKRDDNSAKVYSYIAVMFVTYWFVVNAFESFWYMKAGLWTYTVFMAAIYTIPLAARYDKYLSSLNKEG
ncbi:O-antigen ligase family protein [Neptuniibacter sp. SY11_33]|uniref:O-antigen ligase family protein n=1 Tax=Neptuniibacter sp. SY11_33 TaxID=3398215 RepID=UPI0039F5A74D